MHFASGIHRMIKLGLSISANDEGPGVDDDLPLLEKIEHAMNEATKMKGDIDHITGENIVQVSSPPLLDMTRKKSLKRFVIVDWMDEYAAQQLKEFDGKTLSSTMKEGLDIENEDERMTQFAGHN
eukprot:1547863-Heterocapsa_arctica.AAC.1